jgi:hypothetical protein
MQLVDYEREGPCLIGGQPFGRPLEHRLLALAHQHYIEHRVVRDEDVGRRHDHVPASKQLTLAWVGELRDDIFHGVGHCI